MESLFLPPEAERATWVEDEPIAAMSKEATDSRRFVTPPSPRGPVGSRGVEKCLFRASKFSLKRAPPRPRLEKLASSSWLFH